MRLVQKELNQRQRTLTNYPKHCDKLPKALTSFSIDLEYLFFRNYIKIVILKSDNGFNYLQ